MGLWENGGNVAPPYPGVASSGFRASSEYGMRFHPIDKVWRLHAGLDTIGFSVVCAPEDGLLRTTYAGGYGNLASVFSAGAEHRLAHNARFLASDRSRVTAGQPIAIMGSTGASTGNHCHHEIYVGGRLVNPRDYMASAAGGGSSSFPGGANPAPTIDQGEDMFAIKSSGRSPVAVALDRPPIALTDEEYANFVGGVRYDVNDRQYDLALSVWGRSTANPSEAFVGKGASKNRPWTLFDVGFMRVLSEEELSNLQLTVRRVVGNDRQYDIWVSIATTGTVPASAGITDAQVDRLAAEIAGRLPGADTAAVAAAVRAEFTANPLK